MYSFLLATELQNEVEYTLHSKIFVRVLFSRNFTEGFIFKKLLENKTLTNGKITMSFTDVGKSCPSREFLTLFAKINFRVYSMYAMPWCLHLVDADTKAWHKLGKADQGF